MSEYRTPVRAGVPRAGFTRLLIPALLLLGFVLAVLAATGDSITFDETSHLTSGMSYLVTGDFRLAPDHPPLAKMWAALPILLLHTQWPPVEMPDWHRGVVWNVGKAWLFRLNRGESFLPWARLMIVVLFLALCLLIYHIARRLFGEASALLSLALAVLCPIFLAHGHLVTTDVPIAFTMLLTLVLFARLLERVTLRRLLAAALSLCATALTKFSWPILLIALVGMALFAIVRAEPLRLSVRGSGPSREGRTLEGRGARALTLGGMTLVCAVLVWAGIWTCYGWHDSPFRTADAATAVMAGMPNAGQSMPQTMDDAWSSVLTGYDGKAMGGAASVVRFAHSRRLLPEAYLFGTAYTLKGATSRASYLMGRFYPAGSAAYFPIAFAIKTPIPTMLFLLAGAVALLARRVRPRDTMLFFGLVLFVAAYTISSFTSALNIGHRHLLPLYGPLLIVAGASWAWVKTRPARVIAAVLLVQLAAAIALNHPHYLSYFNELVGGSRNGIQYLADSNLDWGQDIKRLAAYTRRHPKERIKLAYFGSGEPNRYGFECEMLPSNIPFREPCALTAGTYVASATQLLGLYDLRVRDDYWARPDHVEELRRLVRSVAAFDSTSPAADVASWRTEQTELDALRRRRLLYELRHRREDERIGGSLFVYRLSASDVDSLTTP